MIKKEVKQEKEPITRQELIKKYLEFFKKHNHKEIPGASLIPANDPTVLFTTAGMHPLVPFLLGQPHPLGKRLVDVQGCIRTGDIDEVGDSCHHTFFEMLGNWSLGDYFKKEAIELTFNFHTKILGIPLDKYAVTCFVGDKDAPKDEESAKIWKNLGIKEDQIAFLPKEDNWWGPAGATGPCGPDTEQFFWTGKEKTPKKFNPKDKNWVEIGNNVIIQYVKDNHGNYTLAKQKNIDFGGGVERALTILNNLDDNYLTSIWQPIIKEIEKISDKKYGKNKEETKSMRIIADHLKASIMILSDGVIPSNTERGYVLRRLIRRAIRHANLLGINESFTNKLIEPVIKIYPDYSELKRNKNQIAIELNKEENKFRTTLEAGIKNFEKIAKEKNKINCKDAFLLYQSYGFPIEMTQELAKERNIEVDKQGFEKECQIHQELSRTSSSGQFKSGLADNSEATTKLHTACHLLNEALKEVLKDKSIAQKGSNITPERLRFDFNFPRKVEPNELKQIEDWINTKIKSKLEVKREELPLKKAIESGAHGEFGTKYPEIVSVYTIEKTSKEICTGPHVKNTGELGKFKIIKEESSASGIRRIKAILE
jgi:alanyl-tRNA synthetase